MRMRRYRLARLLQNGNGDVPRDTRKIIEKPIERLTSLKIVKQILHWDTRPSKYGYAALDLWVNGDQALYHFCNDTPVAICGGERTKLTGATTDGAQRRRGASGLSEGLAVLTVTLIP
jgi:hypothetical protein